MDEPPIWVNIHMSECPIWVMYILVNVRMCEWPLWVNVHVSSVHECLFFLVSVLEWKPDSLASIARCIQSPAQSSQVWS